MSLEWQHVHGHPGENNAGIFKLPSEIVAANKARHEHELNKKKLGEVHMISPDEMSPELRAAIAQSKAEAEKTGTDNSAN
jgi:hypothetical protein